MQGMSNVTSSWEVVPSYGELGQATFKYTREMLLAPWPLPLSHYWAVVKRNGPGYPGVALVLLLAVSITLARQRLTERFLKPLGALCLLTPGNRIKFPESACKLLFYTLSWAWTLYVAGLKFPYFQQPSKVFTGWHLDKVVPWEVSTLYAVEFSYYLHSIYALFCLDVWRKDSAMLVLHHLLTMLLVACSYLGRYTETGCLVLLFHDGCDVFLELAKVMSYFRIQGGKPIRLFDVLANVGFAIFVLTWFVSRLFYFPLKQIYPLARVVEQDFFRQMPWLNLCFLMILSLLAMNLWWSLMIASMVFRILTGPAESLEDVREYDAPTRQERNEKGKKKC